MRLKINNTYQYGEYMLFIQDWESKKYLIAIYDGVRCKMVYEKIGSFKEICADYERLYNKLQYANIDYKEIDFYN